MESLVIIGPILFIALMIATPIIGVFAGWKRAAYWGGGTFFFYLVGVIVWKCGGTAIANNFVDMINNLLKDMGVTATETLLASLAAPIFFLLVMAIAELVLLINYYAWFKRVSGVKADICAKKYLKAVKKNNTNNITKYKAYAKPEGWTKTQLTSKGHIINMTTGAAGLALLLAPSTVTFAQATMYLTTSSTTRATNSFSANIYNSLQSTAKTFSWMSYYGNGDTAVDYDSIFSGLELYSKKISYIDPTSGSESGQKTAIDAIGDSVGKGIENVIDIGTKAASQYPTNPQAQATLLQEAVNNFAKSWNNIIDNAQDAIITLFQSTNVTEALEETLANYATKGLTLDVTKVTDAYGEGSVFRNIVGQLKDGYARGDQEITIKYTDTTTKTEVTGTFTALKSIPVTQAARDNIKNAIYKVINTEAIKDDQTAKDTFDAALNDILSMLFYIV